MPVPTKGVVMDFFEAQAQARRRTARLVWLFAFAVAGTIASCYVAAIGIVTITGERGGAAGGMWWRWDPTVFGAVTGVVLAIVGLASLFKWAQLRTGGHAIAEMVGGQRVKPSTTDPLERRLLNVVEEMSIAAGMSVPAVYVLPGEEAINAFAAGLTTQDAVVAVTHGTLRKLSRDELQGVIGHEFSHILNGDMRLNVRLLAILFGILVLGLIGRGILRGLLESRVRVGGKKNGGAIAAIALIGLALFVIGMVGYFFGRLIQSAVSRQREYLADAAAVQFTRNPHGLSGALRKIGGEAHGARIEAAKAAEIGHFFFAEGVSSWFGGLFATHPPLEERIKAVDPSWNGQYTGPAGLDDILDGKFGAVRESDDEASRGAPPPLPGNNEQIAFAPAAVMGTAGTLSQLHHDGARKLLANVPAALMDAARDPLRAPALAYALVFSTQPEVRKAQMQVLNANDAEQAGAPFAALEPAAAMLSSGSRLALAQITAPTLRELSPEKAARVAGVLKVLIRADAQVTAFELALERLVARAIDPSRAASGAVSHRRIEDVAGDIACVLGKLALADKASGGDAAGAFAKAAEYLAAEAKVTITAPGSAELQGMEPLGAALDRLSRASLPIKKHLLTAAARAVEHDGQVGREEAELFRAIAAVLDCPIPLLAD